MEPSIPPSSSPLVSGAFLATSIVGGLAFLASLAFWAFDWAHARGVAAFVFGLAALPLGPVFLAKLSKIRGFARSVGGVFSFLCLLVLWVLAAGSSVLGGPDASLQAHPLVALLGTATVFVAFLFAPPRKEHL
jgi:hypothetical protein